MLFCMRMNTFLSRFRPFEYWVIPSTARRNELDEWVKHSHWPPQNKIYEHDFSAGPRAHSDVTPSSITDASRCSYLLDILNISHILTQLNHQILYLFATFVVCLDFEVATTHACSVAGPCNCEMELDANDKKNVQTSEHTQLKR